MAEHVQARTVAIRLLLSAAVLAGTAVIVASLWPLGVLEAPLARLSMEMLLRALAASFFSLLTFWLLVLLWSD